MSELVQGRECGDCRLCCKLLGVGGDNWWQRLGSYCVGNEGKSVRMRVSSPPGEWCRHACAGVGCKIYETRPQSCRDFECAWLEGLLDEEDRPDRSRVLVWCDEEPEEWYVHEASPGVLRKRRGRRIVKKLQQTVWTPNWSEWESGPLPIAIRDFGWTP